MVLKKTLESPLDFKEIKPVNSKGNHCIILVFVFLAYFTCIMGSSFIHLIRTDSNEFFLMAQ